MRISVEFGCLTMALFKILVNIYFREIGNFVTSLASTNFSRNVTSMNLQGGSNMTGTNCDLFTHNQSRSYLNHLVCGFT